MSSSVGMIIPNIWKVIKFHGSIHHQPDISLTIINHYQPLLTTINQTKPPCCDSGSHLWFHESTRGHIVFFVNSRNPGPFDNEQRALELESHCVGEKLMNLQLTKGATMQICEYSLHILSSNSENQSEVKPYFLVRSNPRKCMKM